MSQVIEFPNCTRAKIRISCIQFNDLIDAEMAEIHAGIDGEIRRKYGSMRNYGKHLMRGLNDMMGR